MQSNTKSRKEATPESGRIESGLDAAALETAPVRPPSPRPFFDSSRAMTVPVEVDNLVVGAGVVGLAIGAELSRRGRSIYVIEAGQNFGRGISSRNSEVIHSGVYYPAGSLKHLLCVEGRRRLYAYCDSRGIAYHKCGKLVVSTNDLESEGLAALARRAEQNDVENVEILDGPAARRMEPALRAVSALHVKETGIVESHGLMLSLSGRNRGWRRSTSLKPSLVVGPHGGRGTIRSLGRDSLLFLAIRTRALVIAAGPWTNALVARFEGMAALDPPGFFGERFVFRGFQTVGVRPSNLSDARSRRARDTSHAYSRWPSQIRPGRRMARLQ